MFKNFSYKLFAFGLAVIFWIFVVGLKSAFIEFPTLIPVQVLNSGEKLAVAEITDGVKLTLQAENPDTLRRLKQDDFEAYVDLENFGVGEHKVPVFVNSKNSKVSVFKIVPSEAAVRIEAVQERIMPLLIETSGLPAQGFVLKNKTSGVQNVKISGAENILAQAYEAAANYQFDGTEKKSFSQKTAVGIFDSAGKLIVGLASEPAMVEVSFELVQAEIQKQVGVRVKTTGSPAKGFIKALIVDPAVITIAGETQAVSGILFVNTELIDLRNLSGVKEFKADLELPEGVKAVEGGAVKVKVEVGEE